MLIWCWYTLFSLSKHQCNLTGYWTTVSDLSMQGTMIYFWLGTTRLFVISQFLHTNWHRQRKIHLPQWLTPYKLREMLYWSFAISRLNCYCRVVNPYFECFVTKSLKSKESFWKHAICSASLFASPVLIRSLYYRFLLIKAKSIQIVYGNLYLSAECAEIENENSNFLGPTLLWIHMYNSLNEFFSTKDSEGRNL